jgi:FkbM family methyltransferase
VNQRLAQAVGRTRLYHLYNRAFGRFDYRTIDFFIHEYSRTRRDVFFIQVGANDGITWDPFYYFIRRDRWKGIVIEPQREVFEQKLKATYQNVPGIRLMNVAVDAVDGFRPLYKYSFTSSRWATGAASFDKRMLIDGFKSDYIQDNIKREHLTVSNDPDEYLTSELVECVTFDTILDILKRDTIDFLCTDVEGCDAQILDTFPLNRIRPAHIVFELSRRDATFYGFLTKLAAHRYDVFMSKGDAIALRRDGVTI